MYYGNNELYHFGVPGMKWGVRKARLSSGGAVRLAKRKQQLMAKNEKLAVKRDKQLARADKKLNYATKRTIDWGNKGRYQMNKAMRLTAKANKKYKRIVRNDMKISEIDKMLSSNGENYIKEKFGVKYTKDKYKRIVDHEIYKK